MSQGLSSIIPRLSIEDACGDTEEWLGASGDTEEWLGASGDTEEWLGASGDTEERLGASLEASAKAPMNFSSLLSTLDTCCSEMKPLTTGPIDVRVTPALVQRTNSHAGSIMEAYHMLRIPRGRALIIDIEVYENDVHERRTGSHMDVQHLSDLLKGLSFEVEVEKDLTQRDFYRVIRQFSKDDRHTSGDMIVVAVLSHGGEGGKVYTADNQSIDMEDIYELFNNQNSGDLQGKPKFFIVQACRGSKQDQGVNGKKLQQGKKRRTVGLDRPSTETDGRAEYTARPTWEDMIIAYSTIPNYASQRDHEDGSWFIRSLVEVFSNHAHDTELVDLLRKTSSRLSEYTNDEGEKQTCNVDMRHLYKRVYFNPGLASIQHPGVLVRSISTPPVLRPGQYGLWSPGCNKENLSERSSSHMKDAVSTTPQASLNRNSRDPTAAAAVQRNTDLSYEITTAAVQRNTDLSNEITIAAVQRNTDLSNEITAAPVQRNTDLSNEITTAVVQRNTDLSNEITAAPVQRNTDLSNEITTAPVQRNTDLSNEITTAAVQFNTAVRAITTLAPHPSFVSLRRSVQRPRFKLLRSKGFFLKTFPKIGKFKSSKS